jgi:phosphonate transport system substrate-binding protein
MELTDNWIDLQKTWKMVYLSLMEFRKTNRRNILAKSGAIFASCLTAALPVRAQPRPIQFGLTPVFLTNDVELLSKLSSYLSRAVGHDVQLVQRRTYEEITTLLLSGQLDAAWICGFPFAQYLQKLSIVAVPLWRQKPLYQSYLIVPNIRGVTSIDDLRGDIHAFSDPNSNSGYLVTAALLAERKLRPDQFFKKIIFTYGHRNVVRAVASGLAQSGSVDGYVWDVMSQLEPDLTMKTKIIRKSEELGFPPVACLRSQISSENVRLIQAALLEMKNDPEGQDVLKLLKLDGFETEPESLYNAIVAKMELVRGLGT